MWIEKKKVIKANPDVPHAFIVTTAVLRLQPPGGLLKLKFNKLSRWNFTKYDSMRNNLI